MFNQRKNVFRVAVVGSIIFLGACAEYPSRVAPAYIPSIIYNGASCAEINRERGRVAGYVENLVESQGYAADSDMVAVLLSPLFTPTLLAIPMSVDQSAHLAVARGHYNALVEAGNARGCGTGHGGQGSPVIYRNGKPFPGDFPPM